MKSINLIDIQFSHGTSLGSGDLPLYPKSIRWDRSLNSASFYTFVTEASLGNPYLNYIESGRRIAFIIEPFSINPAPYNLLKDNHASFAYILSHDKAFLKTIPNGLYYPFGGCWIRPEDRKVWPKTKFISIIASGKNEAPGHKLRHEVISKYANKYGIDVFGRGYKPIDYKLEALKDYCYSIVIENESSPGWFTEKLIDCVSCGTIPIYWGAPDIYDYFDGVKGFFNFKNLEEFLGAKKELCVNYYKESMRTTEKILEISKRYTCPEDWLFKNYPQLFQ